MCVAVWVCALSVCYMYQASSCVHHLHVEASALQSLLWHFQQLQHVNLAKNTLFKGYGIT